MGFFLCSRWKVSCISTFYTYTHVSRLEFGSPDEVSPVQHQNLSPLVEHWFIFKHLYDATKHCACTFCWQRPFKNTHCSRSFTHSHLWMNMPSTRTMCQASRQRALVKDMDTRRLPPRNTAEWNTKSLHTLPMSSSGFKNLFLILYLLLYHVGM